MAVAVTYDILDCGPRNRFVANGKLVHNSGGDKQNAQNLNRVDSRDPTSGALRMSWTAPRGHVIVVRDLGQIECLGEDTLVLTHKRGYVRIPEILKSDKLWDGVQWVSHSGVIFKGVRRVIEYEGVKATPDHIVYLAGGGSMPIAEAKAKGAKLAVGERSGKTLRFLEGASRCDSAIDEGYSGLVRMHSPQLRGCSPCPIVRFAQGNDGELREAPHAELLLSDLAGGNPYCSSSKIQSHSGSHQSEREEPIICSVSQERNRESVLIGGGVCSLHRDRASNAFVLGSGDRSHRQQRPLRAWESSDRDQRGERTEPGLQCGCSLARREDECYQVYQGCQPPVPSVFGDRDDTERSIAGADNSPSVRETAGGIIIEEGEGVIPVYDILNAGPNFRFTANGKIVSNCRKLVYVAGQEDMLDMFRAGGDPYDFMAGKVYGRKVDRKHVPEDKNPGQVGKIIVLGCLGPDTIVITNHGCKKIIYVRHSDMVWDGVEYVSHLGVKYQGEKECLTHAGLSATPDHEILTEHGWQEWSEVRMRPFLFRSAIRKASLLSLSGEDPLPGIIRTSNARAAIGRWYTGLILLVEKALDAIFVLKKRVGQLLRSIGDMLLLSQMITTENDFSTAFHLAFSGAKTTETTNTKTTEREGYEYVKRGLTTGKNFLNTLPLLKVGTWRITNWIGSITTKAMSLVTCVFAAKRTTSETEEQSSSSRKRLPTYDVLCAGPRNCFAVMTDYGPIIVHNCGYQMGAWKLQENIRVGFMGMPGFTFGQDYVIQLGVDVEAFCFQKSYKKGFRYAKDEAEACKPMNVSLMDHITHCAVTKFLIDTFRRENGSVVALWKEAQASLDLIIAGSKDVQVGARGLVFTCEEGLVLPNGMKLRYNKLRKTSDGKGYKYLANVRKKEWTNIYGGKVVENIVQALARIIISDQLLRVQNNLNGYDRRQGEVFKAASTTHDEIICLVPERVANECLDMMGREMKTPPKWCSDLPLKSSGGFAFRYGECEK